MNQIVGLIIFACIYCRIECVSVSASEQNLPTVSTELGEIRGRYLKSRLGSQFHAFRGIRYAEPPVNDLRFQPPVPVKSWNETFDATEDGPICVQFTRLNPNEVSEDCLRLNVYTRNISPAKGSPVIIYFHPGGFYELSGQSKTIAGPEYFMDHEIVLVTANYRLGVLGFLSTGTDDAPGNNGLKDQVQVLRWVQRNIDRFGGDTSLVTIMGYSAGSMSVTLHLVSPMSRGLFHRAIVMSGSAIAQWQIPNDQLNLAKQQAQLLNCSGDAIDVIVDCLKKASKEDIANTTPQLFEFADTNPIILFKPVIEADFGQERFLTQDPTCAIKDGQFQKVDILTGITEFEFLFPAINILQDDTLRQQMISNLTQLAPVCFLYERDSANSNRITSNLKSNYFGNASSPDWLTFDGLKNLFADGVIGFGAHRFAQLASAHTTVYQYKFSYVGRYSHTLYPNDKPYGAVHHDDLLYLFRVPVMTPMFNESDPENQIVASMTGYWSNFALTGNPNVGAYIPQVAWVPFTSAQPQYLDINEKPIMKSNLFTERYSIWDNLFPLNEECKPST